MYEIVRKCVHEYVHMYVFPPYVPLEYTLYTYMHVHLPQYKCTQTYVSVPSRDTYTHLYLSLTYMHTCTYTRTQLYLHAAHLGELSLSL